jgi:hypothetical protein
MLQKRKDKGEQEMIEVIKGEERVKISFSYNLSDVIIEILKP